MPYRIDISKDVTDIFDACSSAVIVLDQHGIIAFANLAIETIFGYKKDDIREQSIELLIPTEYRQKHAQLISGFHQQPKNRSMGNGLSFPGLHKDGHVIHVCISLKPLQLRSNQFTVATINEASLFNQVSHSLEQSQQKLKSRIEENKQLLEVAQNAHESVLLLNPEGYIHWHNKEAEEIFVNKLNLQIGDCFLQLSEQVENDAAWKMHETAIKQGLATQQDIKIRPENEKTMVLQVAIHPVFDEDHLQGFCVYVKDISQQRRLETQLKENNEILETTARIASLGFYSLDIQTNALSWSQEVYNIHDLPVDSPIDVEKALTFYAPQALPVISDAVSQCMQSGEPFDLELPFITAKKREIWVRAVGYADFENGEPVKLKGAFQDITYMRQAAIEANQAMRAKSAFLANMSHELRTPINGIVGLTDILSRTELSDKQREYTQMTGQNAQALLYLVNQVLDYSKLEANKLGLRSQMFDLSELLEETLYIHKLAAQNKHIAFELELAKDLPAKLTCDKDRLKQIIHNLCSNALKFTDRGTIRLELSVLDNTHIQFSLTDTGIGIDPQDQSKLFVEFQQLDNSFSRKYGGTGLGLTIVKQLVDLMGGDLGMQSEPQKGSRFWFTIPIGNTQHQSQSLANSSELPDTLVLVGDNEQLMQWREFALTQGLALEVCSESAAFLSKLKDEYRWKIILIVDAPTDVPTKTLMASIQRACKPQHHLCVIDTLANEIDKHSAAFVMTSASGLLSPLALIEQVSNYYVEYAKQVDVSLSGKSFLLAEDNEINQLVCKEMLEAVGAKVTIAEDGTQVMAALQAAQSYDAIIMDCQMPVLDGYQTSMMIRHHKDLNIRQHKIVAATAHGLQEDIQRCYDVGMDDVLIKPFTRAQLFSVLARNL